MISLLKSVIGILNVMAGGKTTNIEMVLLKNGSNDG